MKSSVIILLAGLLWIIASRVDGADRSTGTIVAPRLGYLAPGFSLTTITGEQLQLSAFLGKPVILTFWASWCPPCRAEMPAFQAMSEQYQDQLAVLGVNATNQDDPSSVATFLAQNAKSFPILLDPKGEVQARYSITALPTTFFIDVNGQISDVVYGGPLTEAGLEARLAPLFTGVP